MVSDAGSLVFFMEKIKPRLMSGVTQEEIASELGIAPDAIQESVRQYSLPYCIRDGPALFDDVRVWLQSMFHFDEPKDAALVTLMIFQTRIYTGLPCVFYIFVAGKAGSGKTSLLTAMAMLGNGILLGNISPAAMAREVGRGRELSSRTQDGEPPVYHLGCFDEYDAKGDKDRHAAMDELLRHGYKRGGPAYIRWNLKGNTAECYDMYMPKVVAISSSLEPALSSRGFKISATPHEGPNGFEVLLNNRYPSGVQDLKRRLDDWGESARGAFNANNVEELERSQEHAERVKRATGALGANRESELALTATTIAAMIGIDLSEELKHGVETLFTAGEEYEDEIEELNNALLRIVSQQRHIESAASVTIKQSEVKKAIDEEREQNRRRPLSSQRFAAIYRAAGVKTSWVRNRGGRNYWVIPLSHLEVLKSLVNSANSTNLDEGLGQTAGKVDQVDRVRLLREDAEKGIPYDALVKKYGEELVKKEKIPRIGGRGI